MHKRTKILGFSFAVISLICFSIFYFANQPLQVIQPFSNHEVLENLWANYKTNYIDATGRAIDKDSTQGESITTSEGQSYTMLRSVWMADKEMFDKSFTWTQQNMTQENGHLLSWLYGKKSDGSLG